MYIIERIVGVATYSLLLLFVCWLIRYQPKKYTSFILKMYIILLCILAFFFVPDTTFDLYRLRISISYWTKMSIFDVLKYAITNSTPTWVLYSYFINKLGNPNWLQTITCMITFSLIFGTLCKIAKRWNMYRCDVAIILLLIMSNGIIFMQTISGIRTMISFSIIFWCLYRELFEKKPFSHHIIQYLFAGFMHSAALVLIAGRITFLAFQRESKRRAIANYLICGLSLAGFLLVAIRFVLSSVNKAMAYLNNPNEYFYIWQFGVSLIGATATLYILAQGRKCILKSNTKSNLTVPRSEELVTINNWKNLCLGCQVVSLFAAPFSYAIFTRFSAFSSLLSIPLFAIVSKYRKGKPLMRLRQVLVGMALFMLILSCARGDLCGYKFFVLA